MEEKSLQGYTVIAGVTGGIAAYKAVDLVRALTKKGAEVHVVMSRSAREFVGEMTFQAISGNTVHTEVLHSPPGWNFPHLELAEVADVVVVAPATAHFLSRAAWGMADDLLSTMLLGCEAPVFICPAMNPKMYRHPVVKENIQRLGKFGYTVIPPDTGYTACGDTGPGRLPEVSHIVNEIEKQLVTEQDLSNHTFLITAGATREPIDPVRFITNKSTGKMGFSLARAAHQRGARVILVSGQLHPEVPEGVEFIEVNTALEMYEEVLRFYKESDVVIKSAAVGDYRPKEVSGEKIKKDADTLVLELEKNPDILYELGRKKDKQLLVGFAAETEDLVNNAEKKVKKKNLDMIVANQVNIPGAGFGSDTNIVKLLLPGREVEELPLMDKKELAHRILDKIKKLK